MKTGTKSVLFGAHAFWLHPFFVAAAWTKLYGFPWDTRLWFAFMLHDIGYIGLDRMDDEKGEEHPKLGAKVMGFLFDWGCNHDDEWYLFTLLHSRHYAKKHHMDPSPLCVADKLVPCLMPAWLYVPMATATGEIKEYMENGRNAADDPNTTFTWFERFCFRDDDPYWWFAGLQNYMQRWVDAHKDGQKDSWTIGQAAILSKPDFSVLNTEVSQ